MTPRVASTRRDFRSRPGLYIGDEVDEPANPGGEVSSENEGFFPNGLPVLGGVRRRFA
jgi:hypothetical protein